MKQTDKEKQKKYIQRIFDRINQSPTIPQENKTALENFYTHIAAQGVKDRTITLYLYAIDKFLFALDNIRYDKVRKEELNRTVVKIRNNDNLGERTKAEIIGNIKMFYKYTLGKGKRYPIIVEDLRAREPQKVILPEDILTEDEIIMMLNACNNLRDRAIIASLYDTGARIGELMNVKLNDISFNSKPVRVKLNGKTGERSVPIYFSVTYLKQYIDTIKDLKSNEVIWKAMGENKHKNKGEPIDYDAFWCMLSLVGKKAGITKRVNPHSFRHARATYLAKYMTEQQLKKYLGWTAGSEMASIYVHLNTEDVDNAFLKASGVSEEEISKVVKVKPKLVQKSCPGCMFENISEALYCSRCGVSLSTEIVRPEYEIAEINKRLDIMSDYLFDKGR